LVGELKLEGFTVLKKFHCNNNYLTGLDISNCLELVLLDCGHNQLTKLVLPENNSKLAHLYLYNNDLKDVIIKMLRELPDPEKIITLSISLNNITKRNLTFLESFINLERL